MEEEENSQRVILELNAFLLPVPSVKFLSSPLLILHGEDDSTVPLENGKQVKHELSPTVLISPSSLPVKL